MHKMNMNQEIILRIRSPQGQHRIIVKPIDTLGEVVLQISKACNYSYNDVILETQQNKMISLQQERKKIHQIPYFKNGAIFQVRSKNTVQKKKQNHVTTHDIIHRASKISQKCNHSSGGKCLNCLPSNQSSKSKKQQQQKKQQNKCNHGPGGKCLNCVQIDPKNQDIVMKWMCQHGPNAKCTHCLDKQFISNTAHISFDQYLADQKLKCKGVHPTQARCGNCMAPTQIRYQVDKSCKNHQPYPKAMCNKCIPPNVVIKRQQYRHVDYVQFMNVESLSKFIQFWVQKKHMGEQRVGFLYGYYAQDPYYKNGIRCIVQAIYSPKQKSTFNTFEIEQRLQQLQKIDKIAQVGLGFEKVGWIYTQNNHDVIMSQHKVRKAAQFQQKYQVSHASGYLISNFITVILRSINGCYLDTGNDKNKNYGNVQPEVYMISDQGQALEKYQLFMDTDQRKVMKVKTAQTNKQFYPGFICGGKTVTQFQPQFLLAKIAHGSSKSNKFAYLKSSQFPVINQQKITKQTLKNYLKKNSHKKSFIKYADFNLLIYLAQITDIGSAITVANCVQHSIPISQGLEDFIMQIAQS